MVFQYISIPDEKAFECMMKWNDALNEWNAWRLETGSRPWRHLRRVTLKIGRFGDNPLMESYKFVY